MARAWSLPSLVRRALAPALLLALTAPAGALGPPRAYLVQPIDTSAPLGIAAGPDRRIWYTKSGTDAIGRKNVQSPFAAGVDLLLYVITPVTPEALVEHLAGRVARGEIAPERIDESVMRLLRLPAALRA